MRAVELPFGQDGQDLQQAQHRPRGMYRPPCTVARRRYRREAMSFWSRAASGSSSLTVFSASPSKCDAREGSRHHDGETRFRLSTALESGRGERQEVSSSLGSDDGITRFELNPRGGKLKLWGGLLEDSDGVFLKATYPISKALVTAKRDAYLMCLRRMKTGITHLTASWAIWPDRNRGNTNDEV